MLKSHIVFADNIPEFIRSLDYYLNAGYVCHGNMIIKDGQKCIDDDQYPAGFSQIVDCSYIYQLVIKKEGI